MRRARPSTLNRPGGPLGPRRTDTRDLKCGEVVQGRRIRLGILQPHRTVIEGPCGARVQVWGPALPNATTFADYYVGAGDRWVLVATQAGPLPEGLWFDRTAEGAEFFRVKCYSTAVVGEVDLEGEFRAVWGDAS